MHPALYILPLDNRTTKSLRHDLFLIFLPSSLHLTPTYPLHQILSIFTSHLTLRPATILFYVTLQCPLTCRSLPAISEFPAMNPEMLQAQWLVFLCQQYQEHQQQQPQPQSNRSDVALYPPPAAVSSSHQSG